MPEEQPPQGAPPPGEAGPPPAVPMGDSGMGPGPGAGAPSPEEILAQIPPEILDLLPPEIIDGIATGQIPLPMVEQMLAEIMSQGAPEPAMTGPVPPMM